MTDIEWSAPAQRDLEAIDDYLFPIDPEVADKTLARIKAAGSFLTNRPRAGAPLDVKDARKWAAAGTNYILVYRPTRDRIEILRIYHASQNWREAEQ